MDTDNSISRFYLFTNMILLGYRLTDTLSFLFLYCVTLHSFGWRVTGEAISLLSITCVGDEFVSQCLRIIDAVKRPVEMLSPDHELYQCLEEYACLRSLNLIGETFNSRKHPTPNA